MEAKDKWRVHVGMMATQPTTFPLETMTEEQREVFRQYLSARRETEIELREPIWLALLLACERPATELLTLAKPPISTAPEPSITVEEVVDSFDLVYEKHTSHSIDVARTAWRFDLINSSEGWSEAHVRRAGCFFGYPPADIEHYLTSEPPDTQPAELVEAGLFRPAEVAFTAFLPQRHDDSIAGYKRAIETGKRIRKTIADLANVWALPELETWTEQLYQDARTDCLVKCEK